MDEIARQMLYTLMASIYTPDSRCGIHRKAKERAEVEDEVKVVRRNVR